MHTLSQIDSRLGLVNYTTDIAARGFRLIADEPQAKGSAITTSRENKD